MEELMLMTINEDIKNLDDLQNRYMQAINNMSPFQSHMIKDPVAAWYYDFCVKSNDYSVDEIIKMLDIKEDKQIFLERMEKVIQEAQNAHFASIEQSHELTLSVRFKEFSDKNIKLLLSCANWLRQKNNKGLKVRVNLPTEGLKKSQLEKFLDLSETLGQDLTFYEHHRNNYENEISLNKVIEAYGKMDEFVEKVESMNLSPFEKFLLVHDYAANRIYKKSDCTNFCDSIVKSRSFVNVMTNDCIVCVGYAQIVKEFCKRLGIECECIYGSAQTQNEDDFDGHAANIVHIVDEKYGINGYYFCDACWDCKSRPEQQLKKYFYAALPMQDIDKIGSKKYFSHIIDSKKYTPNSKPISVKTFRKALNNIYSDQKRVELNLQSAIKQSVNDCAENSDNDFLQEYYRQKDLNF